LKTKTSIIIKESASFHEGFSDKIFNMQDNNRRPQTGQSQRRPGSNNSHNPQRNAPDSRNRNYNRNRRYRRASNRTLNSSQVLLKYDNLLDQHLKSRRRYFEYFNRVDDYQRRKLELQFFTTIEHLRRFEASLEDWQKDYLKRKTDKYRLDLTYSTNHELSPVAEPVPTAGDFPDPHFTASMTKAWEEYANDSEESTGSMDDYIQYKNSK
jgi:hypothetical protein